ncbi:DEAD-box ATP-dependent RNA helicase RhpA-like [Paramacrobiotus metropolitanus]|uniref:DEAD-box ATP-dependent RNA helicase RhpA-like n=1 Tax=Paramacrobiotus metropolitanus TaxID=2943436 RepID=UPI002445B01B|nr:DEAD-box ATP-dependent RNA helicase RhpA-like [Paramacrobiotus metropolitanus]
MQNEYRRSVSVSDGVAKAKAFGNLRERISQAGEYFDKWIASWNQACGSVLLVGGNDILDLMLNDLAERKQEIVKLEQKIASLRNNHLAGHGHIGQHKDYDGAVGAVNGSTNKQRNKNPPGHMRSDAMLAERQSHPASYNKKMDNGKKNGNHFAVTITNAPKPIKIEAPPPDTPKPAKKAGLLRTNSVTVKNEKCQELVDNFLKTEQSKMEQVKIQQLGVDQFIFTESSLPRVKTFEEANFKPQLLKNLKEYGFEQAQPVQQCLIPACLSGKNIICQAPSGTGKTSSTALALLQKLDMAVSGCQALVIAPTKETADHYQTDVLALGESQNVLCHSCTSGTSAEVDVMKLKAKPHHIVVGTPGRLYELIKIRQVLVPDQIKTVVLEDGDKLFLPGYKEEVESILALLPANRQDILVCSSPATTELNPLAHLFSTSPPEIVTARCLSFVADGIYQFFNAPEETTRAQQTAGISKHFGPDNVVFLSKHDLSKEELGYDDATTWTETVSDGEKIIHTSKLSKAEMVENFKNNLKQSDLAGGKLNVIVLCDNTADCRNYTTLLRLHPLANMAIILTTSPISEKVAQFRKQLEKEHGLFLIDLVLSP